MKISQSSRDSAILAAGVKMTHRSTRTRYTLQSKQVRGECTLLFRRLGEQTSFLRRCASSSSRSLSFLLGSFLLYHLHLGPRWKAQSIRTRLPSRESCVRPLSFPPLHKETSPALHPVPARFGPPGRQIHSGRVIRTSPDRSVGNGSTVTPPRARVIQLDLLQSPSHQHLRFKERPLTRARIPAAVRQRER